MKTAVLACNTIRDELLLAERRVTSGHEIFWLESNLHNYPAKLHAEMQKELDRLDGYDRVLMAFGFCGNSVADLESRSFELILPRIDDCISLMIGSISKRAKLSEGHQSIYVTEGWIRHESNIWKEYEYTIKKYGEKRAQFVINAMYGKYDMLSIIDTGAYQVDSIIDEAKRIADKFGLDQNVIPGTTSLLELLLTGPWDKDQFVTIPPHDSINTNDLQLFW
ncbi:MAG: DUF1638 domain-containing protein [Treponema sp.]|jgi:hypothetical protein|nr:DUF1638 domain-containing protein [Treponema sp.]